MRRGKRKGKQRKLPGLYFPVQLLTQHILRMYQVSDPRVGIILLRENNNKYKMCIPGI
jgi:hypothetical protein